MTCIGQGFKNRYRNLTGFLRHLLHHVTRVDTGPFWIRFYENLSGLAVYNDLYRTGFQEKQERNCPFG